MGEHGEHADRILSELADARDSILSVKVESPAKPAVKPTPSPVETIATPLVNVAGTADRETPPAEPTPREDPLKLKTNERTADSSKPSTRSGARSGKPIWKEPWATAAGGAIAMLLIMMLFGSGEETKEPANQSTNTTPGNQQKTQPTANNEPAPDKVAVAPPPAVAPFDAAEAKAHQAAWAKYLGVPVEYTNSIGMKFMLIPPGDFMMGAPESDTDADDNEKPQIPVRISRPFYLGKYEVTNREFKELFPEHKSSFNGSELPVSMVNHADCAMYCFRLRHRDMKQYRLPTEAEWEYACRAGTTARFSFGDSMQELNNHSWNESNSGMKPHTVGQKSPNAWGMFDMHGNVWEMCHDGGRHNYVELSALERIQDPIAYLGSERPHRGGGFGRWPTSYLRSSMRGKMGMDGGARTNIVGFRLLLEIPNTDSPSGNPHTTVAKSLPPSLSKDLVAYYPFNGNANDESGNGHHGTTMGGETFVADRHGNSNQAFSSGSNNSYITVPDHNDLDLGNAAGKEMTISLWFNGRKENGSIPNGHFVTKRGIGSKGSSRYCDYYLWNCPDENGIIWGTGRSSATGGDDKNSWMMTGVIPPVGVWHHLVANYNLNKSGGKKVFLNGALIQQGGIGKKNAANNQPLKIGHWPGSLDDVRIYNRALSEAEVKALYEFEKP